MQFQKTWNEAAMLGEMGEMKPGWIPGLGDVVMENLADAKVCEANGSKTDYASGRLPGLSRGIAQAKTDRGFTSCRILPWSSVVTGRLQTEPSGQATVCAKIRTCHCPTPRQYFGETVGQ